LAPAGWSGGRFDSWALGGFFMVSILDRFMTARPGVRTLLGARSALALLAAGEWTRRKEKFPPSRRCRSRNIPATLTAAGTAVRPSRRSTQRMPLYDFSRAGTAFILARTVAWARLAAAPAWPGPQALGSLGVVAAMPPRPSVSFREAISGRSILPRRGYAARPSVCPDAGWALLAVTTIAFRAALEHGPGLTSTRPLLTLCVPLMSGFVTRSALLVVGGLLFAQPADQGRS